MSDWPDLDRNYTERWAGDGPSTTSDADFGPTLSGKHRRRPLLTVLRVIAFGVVTAVVVVAVLAVVLGLYASSQINREPVAGLAGGQSSLNVLVVGSDSREGFSAEELQALGTEAVDGRRTDTIFLLTIRGGRAAMLSFPRDLYVTDCASRDGRINAAYALGGPSCLVQTVTGFTGIGIDHYMEVNLFGFTQIVDAVGGVPVFLDQPLVDRAAGVDLPAGCHVLDGRQAVGFVRARHVDSDLGRIARQQRFIRELAEEVVSANTLVNVPRLFRVAGASGRSITADEGLGFLELVRVARAARGLAGAGLATYTVPVNAANIGGAAVLLEDSGAAGDLYRRFVDGTILDIPTPPEVTAVIPGDVPLRILNGSSVPGLAAQARAVLSARGFEVVEIGNTIAAEDATIVRHPPGQEPPATLVAEQIPGAVTVAESTAEGITLILAADADVTAPPPPPVTEAAAEETPIGSAPVPEACA